MLGRDRCRPGEVGNRPRDFADAVVRGAAAKELGVRFGPTLDEYLDIFPGAEGSPVARNLVRNAYVAPWDGQREPARAWFENPAMWIAEGARPERLRLALGQRSLDQAVNGYCSCWPNSGLGIAP